MTVSELLAWANHIVTSNARAFVDAETLKVACGIRVRLDVSDDGAWLKAHAESPDRYNMGGISRPCVYFDGSYLTSHEARAMAVSLLRAADEADALAATHRQGRGKEQANDE